MSRGATTAACDRADSIEEQLLSVDSEEQWAELVGHLDACEVCRRRVAIGAVKGSLADDLHWAYGARRDASVDVNVPLARLNALLSGYEVVQEIGRGGMGIVFKARHIRLNRMVALKVLPALLGVVRPDTMSRFKREVTILARLQHTNIVPVFDFGEVDGTLYYTMPLIEGRSLRTVLTEVQRTGAIDVVIGCSGGASGPTSIGASHQSDRRYFRQAAQWTSDVAEALDYAHGQGVIHRDIKPSNLLLGADGRMMITDFGLARASDQEMLTRAPSLLGTARYMAPEQLDEKGGEIDQRVDVYGLGATLYELLAFRPMFAAADDREVLDCVLHKEPTPPRRFVPQVPRELQTICLKAVEKSPERRYATAKALADDLRRWLLDLPIHAKRPSLPARARTFIRRRKGPVALGVLLVCAALTAALLHAEYRIAAREATDAKIIAQSRSVRLRIMEARAELAAGRFASALSRVDAAIVEQPDCVEFQLFRAVIWSRMGKPEEARQCYEELLDRDTKCWQAHLGLAELYSKWTSGPDGEYWREDTLNKAAYHSRQVELLMPQTAEAYYVQAIVEVDPSRAISLLDRAVTLGSMQIEFVLERAWRYGQLKKYQAMLLDAERAVAIQSGWPCTHMLKGWALESLGRLEEAATEYGSAIALDPSQAVSWHYRGLIRFAQGRFIEADADATRAISLDPECPTAYLARGHVRLQIGQINAGLADYDRAIELDPDNATAYSDRGYGLSTYLGQWQEASLCFTRAVELAPKEPTYLLDRGQVYLRLGAVDLALADFTRAIELGPNKPQPYLVRARAHFQNSRFDEAIRDLTQAVALTPRDSGALLHRAMVYELARKTDLAMDDYDRVATLGGQDAKWATLWKYLMLRDAGDDAAAARLLSIQSLANGGDVWTDHIFDLFRGDLSPEDLLAAAATDDNRAEAYYYIGRKALFDGRPCDAKHAFATCLALDRLDVMEVDLARAWLARLDARDAATSLSEPTE